MGDPHVVLELADVLFDGGLLREGPRQHERRRFRPRSRRAGMAECLTRRLTSSTVRPVWRSFFAPEAPCLRLYYRTFRLIGAGTRTAGTPIPFLTTGGSDSKVVSPVQRPSRLVATPLTGNRLIHR
jgi:hypothetical protein